MINMFIVIGLFLSVSAHAVDWVEKEISADVAEETTRKCALPIAKQIYHEITGEFIEPVSNVAIYFIGSSRSYELDPVQYPGQFRDWNLGFGFKFEGLCEMFVSFQDSIRVDVSASCSLVTRSTSLEYGRPPKLFLGEMILAFDDFGNPIDKGKKLFFGKVSISNSDDQPEEVSLKNSNTRKDSTFKIKQPGLYGVCMKEVLGL